MVHIIFQKACASDCPERAVRKKIPIYGNGSNIRDWLYVEDHADALLLVLEKGTIGRSYNIVRK